MVIHVAVVDDHPVILAGIQHALGSDGDIKVDAYLRDSSQLVDYLNSHAVDVVLTDYSMPNGRYGDGIAMLRFLRRRFPQIKIALLTGVENGSLLREALNSGVRAVMAKGDDFSNLGAVLRTVAGGGTYVSAEAESAIHALDRTPSPAPRLSKRESEVIRMLAEGLSIGEVGARVGRSPKTVGTQKLSAMRKLGLRSDADVYYYAIAHGMIQASEVSRKGVPPDT